MSTNVFGRILAWVAYDAHYHRLFDSMPVVILISVRPIVILADRLTDALVQMARRDDKALHAKCHHHMRAKTS
jgi:hypothetical protein